MAQRDYSIPIAWDFPLSLACQEQVEDWLDDYDDDLIIEALSEEAQFATTQ